MNTCIQRIYYAQLKKLNIIYRLLKANEPDGIFWKLSHIVPIPKSNVHTNPSNYRPISLLSILNKVLERHVHKVLTEHLSQYMVISRKHNQHNFRTSILLGNEALEIVQRYKYLGVMITSNLSWSEHIHTKCVKAKKLIGLLYRCFYSNADPTTLFKLYTALVCPHLEYACEVWNPHLQKERDQLERIQKYGLRINSGVLAMLTFCHCSKSPHYLVAGSI